MRAALALLALACAWPASAANPFVFRSSSDSMAPAIEKDEIVTVADLPLCGRIAPKPGDIVLFNFRGLPGAPAAPQKWIKRVVAGPGHTVAMKAGRLIIDGRSVDRRPMPDGAIETLGNGASYRILDTVEDSQMDDAPAQRTPAGGYFLLGDNRDNSVDSRVLGPIPAKDICARITAPAR